MRMLWLFVALLWSMPAMAQDVDAVDPLALATRLLADGYPDRAVRVLDEVDVDAVDEAFNLGRFYTLRGLAYIRSGLPEAAIADFRSALTQEGVDPLVNLQLAQALITTGDFEGAMGAVDASGEAGARLPGSFLLKGRAAWQAGKLDEAWVAFVQGQSRFPEEVEFGRQRVFLLIEMGLYQRALVEGRDLVKTTPDDPKTYLVIAEALRNVGQVRKATALLEEARLRFPAEADVYTLLGRCYLELDLPRTGGAVFMIAGELDPTLFAAAAEAYRRAGELSRALYLNSRVPDSVEKARQRLGLYAETGDWSRMTGLSDRLDRLGLLDEDPVAYALAYAWYQLGEVEISEQYLSKISDPRWFQDATTLRQAMAECSAGWGCP